MSDVLLEVCVDTLDGAICAANEGADRIELCSSLNDGGLTPSYGFMRAAAQLPVPVYAMIRPRRGGFVFSDAEKTVILSDIQAAHETGLAGIAIGATTRDNMLDAVFLRDMLKQTSLKATLHRAFDTLCDPIRGVDTAIELGFERILTSGQTPKAEDGQFLISELVKFADNRVSIMAGSGITPHNVTRILAATHVPEIHASCSAPATKALEQTQAIRLGFISHEDEKTTDGQTIRALRTAISQSLETLS